MDDKIRNYEEYKAALEAEIAEWLPVTDIDWAAQRIMEAICARFGREIEPGSITEFFVREVAKMRLAELMGAADGRQ